MFLEQASWPAEASLPRIVRRTLSNFVEIDKGVILVVGCVSCRVPGNLRLLRIRYSGRLHQVDFAIPLISSLFYLLV